MTAPPGLAPTLAPLTGPRSGDAFAAACARRDFASLQDAIRDLSKRDAVDHLHALFPHRTRSWMERNLPYLMALDPDAFWRLTHPDPTGEDAVRNVMKERAS